MALTKHEKELERARQVEALRKLDLSNEEIADVLKADERIDEGEALFEFEGEQKKAVSDLQRSQENKKYTRTKETKKAPNEEKMKIIKAMLEAVNVESATIEHPERIFSFVKNGVKYKVTLSCPRS